METFQLPQGFLMGSATAAAQIEGGVTNSTWAAWCRTPGRIRDGTSCLRANDHWNRYSEDIRIMKELHHDVYRMGLEWSRIEPQEGRFDMAALAHYRDEIRLLIQNGVQPLVTLHHFSDPLWFEAMGEWENPRAAEIFVSYARHVVEYLGDLVSDWITINEPNVYLVYGYAKGLWPPGKSDIKAMFAAMRHMVLAHIQCYREIHQIRTKHRYKNRTMVGVAHHLRIFDPEHGRWVNKVPALLNQYLFQDLFLSSMATGKFSPPIGWGGYPEGKGKYYDFLGINYYTRDMVQFRFDPANLFAALKVKKNVPVNDLGWEIYPQGLYRICRRYYAKYQVPLFITENGICDADDTQRAKFIYEHLRQIAHLNEEGIPVQRYYHWTLIDNFEWADGESARFGLVRNDFETQRRAIRASGRFYGEICRQKAVTGEMIEKYLSL